jgi:hypothetical protein
MPVDPVASAIETLTAQITRLNEYAAEFDKRLRDNDATQSTSQPPNSNAAPPPPGLDFAGVSFKQASAWTAGTTRNRLTDTAAAFQQMGAQQRVMRNAANAAGSKSSASVPPNAKPMSQTSASAGGPNPTMGGSGAFNPSRMSSNQISGWADNLSQNGVLSSQDAMTMAMMGEHGAPAPIRNMALGSYSLHNTLKWAHGAASTPIASKVLGEGGADIVSGALGAATEVNPMLLYGGLKVAQGVGKLVSGTNKNMENMTNVGYNLGYGNLGGAPGSQSFLGIRNPLNDLSDAAREGTAYSLETQALQGGMPGAGGGVTGLSKASATSVMNTVAGQGFNLPLASPTENVVNNIPLIGHTLAPILADTLGKIPILGSLFGSKGPGGNAGDVINALSAAQKATPALSGTQGTDLSSSLLTNYRGANGNLTSLTNTLGSLSSAAGSAHENMTTFLQDIDQSSNAFANQYGGNQVSATQMLAGMSMVNGMTPSQNSSIASNPMTQAALISQGIMPWDISNANPGTVAGAGDSRISQLVNMYTKNGMSPAAAASLVANQYGMQSSQVAQIMNNQGQIAKNTKIQTALGSWGQGNQWDPGNGFESLVQDAGNNPTKKNQQGLEAEWNKTVAPTLKGSGLSKSQISSLDKTSNMRDRVNDLNNMLKKNNTSMNNYGNNTTQVEFTGAAKKFFQQYGGPTPSKKVSNAGGESIIGTIGDIASLGGFL